MSPRALILGVLGAAFAAIVLGVLVLVVWSNAAQHDPPIQIARAPSAPQLPVVSTSTRVDELEARVRALEAQVRALHESSSRVEAPDSISNTTDQSNDAFIEQHRAAINRVIDESRHEQAWMKEKDELYTAACQLAGMGMIGYLGDEVRDDLRDVLVREFKPVFDVQWRIDESHLDPKVLAEPAGALKQAQRGFYAALTARFPVELADRAFARTRTLPYLVTYRDTVELHAEIERGLR